MQNNLTDFEKNLEKIKIEAYTGDYYWHARDIQFLLENCTWNRLYRCILKIEKKCKADGLDTSKDIIRTKTIINDGYERYPVDDFYLSNLIAYQIFAEFSDKKVEVPKERKIKIKEKAHHSFSMYLISFITAIVVICIIITLSIFYIPLKH